VSHRPQVDEHGVHFVEGVYVQPKATATGEHTGYFGLISVRYKGAPIGTIDIDIEIPLGSDEETHARAIRDLVEGVKKQLNEIEFAPEPESGTDVKVTRPRPRRKRYLH
jgi:hypothetical protein